jgi:hypothetical protein
MKNLLCIALFGVLAPLSHAQSPDAPATGVSQLFSCNLNPGRDVDDIWSLLEAVRDQVEDPGAGFSILLWLPLRGSTDYDYIWGVNEANLIASMQGLTNYMSSDSGRALAPRFQALNERCDSVILRTEQLKTGTTGMTADRTPDAMVETFSCQLRAGSSMADARSAGAFWQQQVGKIASDDLAKYGAFFVTPIRGGSGEVDFGWIGTYPDLVSFARGETAYQESREGQAADERFNKASTCRNALWTGYWVMAPTG